MAKNMYATENCQKRSELHGVESKERELQIAKAKETAAELAMPAVPCWNGGTCS